MPNGCRCSAIFVYLFVSQISGIVYGFMSELSLHTENDDTVCPECDGHGKAMCTVLGRGLRTIHYHCLVCREQWMRFQIIPRDQIPFVRLFTND